MTNLVINVPGEYISLGLVMQSALEQASKGKGRERHASEGEFYEDQIICEVARRVGLGYPLGQAVKKIYESQRIGGESGVAELLGAINYIAAAIIVMREGLETASKAEGGCCQNGKDHSPEEPEFKPGDAVEWNGVGRDWLPAVYLREFGDFGHCVVRLPDGRERIVSKADLRRPEANYPENPDSSKPAEGCEDLVQKDAPQTAQELYKRIIANNPATFKARTPTGEELAELAEEEKRG